MRAVQGVGLRERLPSTPSRDSLCTPASPPPPAAAPPGADRCRCRPLSAAASSSHLGRETRRFFTQPSAKTNTPSRQLVSKTSIMPKCCSREPGGPTSYSREAQGTPAAAATATMPAASRSSHRRAGSCHCRAVPCRCRRTAWAAQRRASSSKSGGLEVYAAPRLLAPASSQCSSRMAASAASGPGGKGAGASDDAAAVAGDEGEVAPSRCRCCCCRACQAQTAQPCPAACCQAASSTSTCSGG